MFDAAAYVGLVLLIGQSAAAFAHRVKLKGVAVGRVEQVLHLLQLWFLVT